MKELNEKFLEAFARSVREHPRAIKNNLMSAFAIRKETRDGIRRLLSLLLKKKQMKRRFTLILVPTETRAFRFCPTQARENSSTNSYDHDYKSGGI